MRHGQAIAGATGRVEAGATAGEGRHASELRSWVLLAAGSLAVAGVFAFLLALSRVPGSERFVHWPLEFFPKGLVIHVVFSLVVWFLAVVSLLSSMAAREISGGDLKAAGLGRIGLALVSMAFPLLFLPGFGEHSEPTLNNYIPVIIDPYYYAGLVVLGAGILMPVLRLFVNVAATREPVTGLPAAMTAAGVVYSIALVSFAIGVLNVWGEPPTRLMHEHLFWGGGHNLQFVYCILLLSGWFLLARESLGETAVRDGTLRLAAGLVALFAFASPVFYAVYEPFSAEQQEAFRLLQFLLAIPALMVAAAALPGILRRRTAVGLPWRDPAFLALVLSAAVFAVGGIMGFLLAGQDTRTPAHYHGVIAGVNLAVMGVMLTCVLPRIGRPVSPKAPVRLQLLLFGLGQAMASCGLFLAGGYGAPRKMPSGAVDLVDEARIGMALNGFGALFAVIGGVLFVATVLHAVVRRAPGPGPAATNVTT